MLESWNNASFIFFFYRNGNLMVLEAFCTFAVTIMMKKLKLDRQIVRCCL